MEISVSDVLQSLASESGNIVSGDVLLSLVPESGNYCLRTYVAVVSV